MSSRKVEIEFKGKVTITIDEGKDVDDAMADLDAIAGGYYYDVEDMEILNYEVKDSK